MLFMMIIEIEELALCFGFENGNNAFCFSDTTVLQRLLWAELQPVSRRLHQPVLGKRTGDKDSPWCIRFYEC